MPERSGTIYNCYKSILAWSFDVKISDHRCNSVLYPATNTRRFPSVEPDLMQNVQNCRTLQVSLYLLYRLLLSSEAG